MTEEAASLADALADVMADLERGPERHPIVRSGERDPIPWLVRLSVYKRDGFTCRECGHWFEGLGQGLELDHALPWSAGGSDYSTNLRTLCAPCNQRRSNWRDGAEDSRRAPTTWWCWHCWRHSDLAIDDPDIVDCACETQTRFRTVWRDGTDLTRARYVMEPAVLAFCAFCGMYGYTDLPLDATWQDRLVRLCAPPPLTTPPSQEATA